MTFKITVDKRIATVASYKVLLNSPNDGFSLKVDPSKRHNLMDQSVVPWYVLVFFGHGQNTFYDISAKYSHLGLNIYMDIIFFYK